MKLVLASNNRIGRKVSRKDLQGAYEYFMQGLNGLELGNDKNARFHPAYSVGLEFGQSNPQWSAQDYLSNQEAVSARGKAEAEARRAIGL
jgi:hypothetical protein